MDFGLQESRWVRSTGVVVVLLIHAVLYTALVSGLARKAIDALHGPIEVKIVEEARPPPPPPPERVEAPVPRLQAPPPIFVPLPEFVVTAPAPPAPITVQTTPTPPPAAPFQVAAPAPPAALVPPAPAAKPQARASVSMVCTKMGKPEVPSVGWTGVALFKVTATVRDGRVVGMDVESLSHGVEHRVQRMFVRAIEDTLRDTYLCPGNHVFEQEFMFRIE
jgi:protein TonB